MDLENYPPKGCCSVKEHGEGLSDGRKKRKQVNVLPLLKPRPKLNSPILSAPLKIRH